MKKLILFICFCFISASIFLPPKIYAQSEESEKIFHELNRDVESQLNNIDFSKLDEELKKQGNNIEVDPNYS